MAFTFAFFLDAGLTTAAAGNMVFQQNSDGSTGPVDKVVYLGSTASAKKVQAASNPGVDQISISVVDAAAGSGHPASEVKLATTQGGLGGATGGASLNVGTQLLSGVGNAQPVWVRVQDSTGTPGTSTELSIQCNELTETAQ